MRLLEKYENALRQRRINKEKTSIFFSKNTIPEWR
jgi:hypothetical protein